MTSTEILPPVYLKATISTDVTEITSNEAFFISQQQDIPFMNGEDFYNAIPGLTGGAPILGQFNNTSWNYLDLVEQDYGIAWMTEQKSSK